MQRIEDCKFCSCGGKDIYIYIYSRLQGVNSDAAPNIRSYIL